MGVRKLRGSLVGEGKLQNAVQVLGPVREGMELAWHQGYLKGSFPRSFRGVWLELIPTAEKPGGWLQGVPESSPTRQA